MIDEATIDQVRQANDIVQVIGEYLRLKKRGRNHLALCPFHTEKTASFSVSEDKQIFYCFGCGKGGNVYTFLMEHERMPFVEAVRHLAKRANIRIEEHRVSDGRRELLEKLGYANEVALTYFQKTLRLSRYRSVYADYLQDKRRINTEAIEYFQLGLAGEEWDGLLKYAASKDIGPDILASAGLVSYSEKQGKYFDRFRQRLMFPVFNLSSQPIAFGGRTLRKGEPAKYVNSPETPVYTKGNVLYGLQSARDDIRTAKAVFVVEGYFDVISLWQCQVRNVVASSGTAFTHQQARLLARFADDVYLFFDADSAGRNAAMRSVGLLYDAGLEVKVICSPAGEDPDSLAHTIGRDGIEKLRETALGFIPYRLQEIDVAASGIIEKERLAKEFAQLAGKISDSTRRSLFVSEAAEALGVSVELLQGVVPKDSVPKREEKQRPTRDPYETELLSLLFHNPGSMDNLFEQIAPEDFSSPELARLYAALIVQYQKHGSIDAQRVLDDVRDAEFSSLISEIASHEWQTEQIDSETLKLTKDMISEKRKRIIGRLKKEMADAEAVEDHERASELSEQIKEYL